MAKLYISIDGDNVGSRLENLVLLNDTKSLSEFSETFNSAMIWLDEQFIKNFEATIIFYGGDNLLAQIEVEKFSLETLEILRSEFATRTESTLSIGVGESPQKAYFALKLAKTSGKNSIRHFRELINE